jgi:hypothetical protein
VIVSFETTRGPGAFFFCGAPERSEKGSPEETKRENQGLNERRGRKEVMPMKTRLVLSMTLALILIVSAINPLVSAEKKKGGGDFRIIHEDIQIGNLLTGLYLTDEQTARIAPLARRAGELRETFESQKDAYGKKNIAILAAVRDDVLRTGDASPETKKRFHAAKADFDRVEDTFRAEMKKLNRDVQSILTDNQKCIVSDYKPCIIPVKSIANPERIGQSANNDGIIRALSRAREISAEKFPQAKERFLEHLKPKLEKELSDEEIPGQLKKIDQVVNEARVMSNEEFELKKAALAEKISPTKKENENEAMRRKIDRFLLNPRFIAVTDMRKKLATKN